MFLIALISFFLLPGNLFFFHFFSQSNPNNWKPFQNLQRQPQPLQPPGSPVVSDVLHCRSNPSPGKQKPLQKEKRKFAPESLHCLLPHSAHQPYPCRSAATQSTINYRCSLVTWKIRGCFLAIQAYRFPAKLFNFPLCHPQCYPSWTFIPTAVICMGTHQFQTMQLESHSHRCIQTRFNSEHELSWSLTVQLRQDFIPCSIVKPQLCSYMLFLATESIKA